MRVVLNIKETLFNFLKVFGEGLLGDLSPMRRSWPGLGRDILAPRRQLPILSPSPKGAKGYSNIHSTFSQCRSLCNVDKKIK